MSNFEGQLVISDIGSTSRIEHQSSEKNSGYDTFIIYKQFNTEFNSLMDNLFAKYSISFGRFNILFELDTAPMGLMPSELAQRCKVTQATISGLISGLEKGQIVERIAHENDGRASVVKITEKGKSLFHQVRPEFFSTIEKVFSGLNPAEVSLLQSIFTRLNTEV